MKPLLLRALLLLGIGVNVAFLLINLRPERPHLAQKHKVHVLVRASPWRAQWMKENLFDEFGAAHDLEIVPLLAKSFEDVVRLLEEERDKPTGLLLADLSDEYADDARSGKTVLPFQRFITPAQLAEARGEYLPEAIERATDDGQLWFVPKRALLDVAVYLRPAVEDVYLHWKADRAGIEAALKEANGVGLPKEYDLDKTPDEWDMFDLFVAGWYWAHHPAHWAPEDEQAPAPRLAWRTGHNEAGLNDQVSSYLSHGLKPKELLQLDAASVLDVLQWRALFVKHHLLAHVSAQPGGAGAPPINELLRARKLAWAPIDQADSLWVHGGARRDAEPGLDNPHELDWGRLPYGSSAELNPKTGERARVGKSVSLEEIHFWAAPIHCPDPRLAWELARFVTQRGLMQRETEAVGMLPVRIDLAQDYPILFRLDWMQRMLDASYRQLRAGIYDMPAEVTNNDLGKTYADLEAEVLAGTPPVTLAGVRERVAAFKAKHSAGAGHGK